MAGSAIVPTLARRFLLSKSSDGFLSFIAWVSVVGVSLGVLALTVVTSTINGFENELTRVISGTNGDVIFYTRGEPFENPEKVEDKIRQIVPDVQAVSPTFTTELMTSGSTGNPGQAIGAEFTARSAGASAWCFRISISSLTVRRSRM